MNQIARCDWLPRQARWSYHAHLGPPAVSCKKNFPESQIVNPLLIKLFWSGWLDIGLVLFLQVYGPRRNTQKKNLANIQPPWPHTWSTRFWYVYNILKLRSTRNVGFMKSRFHREYIWITSWYMRWRALLYSSNNSSQ